MKAPKSFRVQRRPCATCIYRADSPLDLSALEGAIADPHCPGFFTGYRICHHSTSACCAGFWARHREHFMLGQLAQRLGFVEYVNDDTLGERHGIQQ